VSWYDETPREWIRGFCGEGGEGDTKVLLIYCLKWLDVTKSSSLLTISGTKRKCVLCWSGHLLRCNGCRDWDDRNRRGA
jgi:hypothetical protein